MKRIDTSTRAVDLFGVGKDGFKDGNLALGVAPTDFNAAWANGMQEEIANVIEDVGIALSGAVLTQLLAALNRRGHVVGAMRNLRASQTAAAATLTYTADELVLKSALGGSSMLLSGFSKAINLATVGAGGMDTGAAPVSGWVAVYAIWNRSTGVSALLGANATAAVAADVYGGANMPAGYTHSALIGVVPTNGSSQIPVMRQFDREVYYFNSLITTSTSVGFTSLSMAAAVPRNAWRWRGNVALVPTSTTTHSVAVCPTSAGQGTPGYTSYAAYGIGSGGTIGASIPDTPIITPQTTFYALTASASLTINSYGYTF